MRRDSERRGVLAFGDVRAGAAVLCCAAGCLVLSACGEAGSGPADSSTADSDPADGDPSDSGPADGDPSDSGPADSEASVPPVGTPPSGQENEEVDASPERTVSSVLVFTRTAGFTHDSIAAGIEAIERLGSADAFAVTHTEDPASFNDEELTLHDVVIFLNTTGNVLPPEGERALERFVQAGGGWVGIHAASDTEEHDGWDWYGGLIGGNAYFRAHPPGTEVATLRVNPSETGHVSVQHLVPSFELEDEWYTFEEDPTEVVRVLLTIDEDTYQLSEDLRMGPQHPMSWCHDYDGGRAWYTALGHRSEIYGDERFVDHVRGGIQWAGGAVE